MNLTPPSNSERHDLSSDDPSIPRIANERSPKRKRTDSVDLKASDVEFAPSLNLPPTSLQAERPDSPSLPPLSTPPQQIVSEESAVKSGVGEGSPRTVVAKSFENLALRGSEGFGGGKVVHFGGGSRGQEVKRARFTEQFDDESTPDGVPELVTSEGEDPANTMPMITSPTTISSTPSTASPTTPNPPPPRQVSRKSPPPPTLSSTPSDISSTFDIDIASLTWQDSEITGHLALDPDDDLTGMNGIGFKPTPQIAYARAQARRRQVAEWRNREARDARARRAEGRRRGMVVRAEQEKAKPGRVVRFAA